MLKRFQVTENITLLQAKNALLNATVIEGKTSLLLIDTFLLPKDSKELRDFCNQLNKPVKYIINTHWHSDHCYGNRFFDSHNPLIIAHENYWDTITREKSTLHPYEDTKINKKILRIPHITFSEKLHLEEFDLTCYWASGHSSDSLTISSSKDKIVWTGDNVLNTNDDKIAVPYFYWGDVNQHLTTLKKILLLEPTTIIPGHGKPCQQSKVEEDILYLKNIIAKMSKLKSTKNITSEIKLKECYPNSQTRTFWVEEMHKLNLDNLMKAFLHELH